MPGPIQTIPQGLLGLLQLKQSGGNPSQLLDSVQSTVDLLQLWLQRNNIDISFQLFGAVSTFAASVHGQAGFTVNPLTVPPGQTWWIDRFSIGGTLLAAEYIRLAPLFLEAGGTTYELGPDYNDVITARARDFAVSVGGFWLPPGGQLGIRIFDIVTAGTITVAGAVRGSIVPI